MSDPPPLRIEHVERPPLPWRHEELTECGLTSVNHPTISRDQNVDKVKREGITRAAYTTCQTCFSTVQRHDTWDANPVSRLARELNRWGNDDHHRQVTF